MMTRLFGPSFTTKDSELMDFLSTPEHESFLEGLWQKFSPYLNSAAEAEFRDLEAQPHPRIWEMFLAIALSEQKFTLSEKLGEGPDIKLSDPIVWVEAVVSTAGAKENNSIHAPSRVPEIVITAPVWGGPPEDKIIERLSASIKEKKNKLSGYDDDRKGKHYRGYIEKGIVKNTEPYVIALNTYKTSLAQFDHQHTPGHIPLIAKVLFGYGDTVLLSLFRRDGKSAPISSDRWDYLYRRYLTGQKEKKVPTNIFFREEYSGISALIVSKEGFWSWRHRMPVPLSENFIVAHNPFARNPLPNGWLKSGHEIWIEQGQLHKRIWKNGNEHLVERFALPTLVTVRDDGRRDYQRVSNASALR
jgi:hypothetical protein